MTIRSRAVDRRSAFALTQDVYFNGDVEAASPAPNRSLAASPE
jgi:hypothetical protein